MCSTCSQTQARLAEQATAEATRVTRVVHAAAVKTKAEVARIVRAAEVKAKAEAGVVRAAEVKAKAKAGVVRAAEVKAKAEAARAAQLAEKAEAEAQLNRRIEQHNAKKQSDAFETKNASMDAGLRERFALYFSGGLIANQVKSIVTNY